MKKIYIPPEIVAEVKKMDLLTYLKNYEPNELVHLGGDNYTTKTHDSLKISNGLWNWFSRGIGGKNAIDYLMKVKGYSFKEAVQDIVNKSKLNAPVYYEKEKIESSKKLILPQKSTDNEQIKDYLFKRGIDEEIIEECIKRHLIYEEKKNHNVIFLGFDKENNVRYAFERAINGTRFMREASGSNKEYSFKLNSNSKNNGVHLFESAIDLLSYATLLKLNGLDYRKENLISCGGIYKLSENDNESKIPKVINKYLSENPNIDNIYLHFDNDFVGREATKSLVKLLSAKYKVYDRAVPMGKDCNDYLCFILGFKTFSRNTNENKKRENVR